MLIGSFLILIIIVTLNTGSKQLAMRSTADFTRTLDYKGLRITGSPDVGFAFHRRLRLRYIQMLFGEEASGIA